MPRWVFSFASCTFVGFADALRGWVVFAAFGANVMEASTCRGVMSKLLAFVALDQLELGGVFPCMEPPEADVESMFDAAVSHV